MSGYIDTVGKLRAELASLPEDMPLVVSVQAYTQRYPSAYKSPWAVDLIQGPKVAIRVTMPEGFIISERKAKA